ncbi:MAG: hypothetical protein HYX92_20275 [Chloroflexi bacterium]|nr:hypothetical protein [Chloroflexota bacterium]
MIDIPESVKQFVTENIESVVHMEALLLLRAGADQEWSAEQVGKRLYIDAPKAAGVLTDLNVRGLLASVRKSDAVSYRYSPVSSALDEVVAEVEGTYRKHLVAITNFIYSKPSTSIRRFADAFRLRKEE